MSDWMTDEPEFYVLDPSGQVLDSFLSRAEALSFAEDNDEAIYVEERSRKRRTIWSAFDEVFK